MATTQTPLISVERKSKDLRNLHELEEDFNNPDPQSRCETAVWEHGQNHITRNGKTCGTCRRWQQTQTQTRILGARRGLWHCQQEPYHGEYTTEGERPMHFAEDGHNPESPNLGARKGAGITGRMEREETCQACGRWPVFREEKCQKFLGAASSKEAQKTHLTQSGVDVLAGPKTEDRPGKTAATGWSGVWTC